MATQQGKTELPTLGGTRIKTRKRDEKVKYDPTSFCEQVIAGLNATGGGLDEISKYLDQGGDQLSYRCAGRVATMLADVCICGWGTTIA